MYVPIGGIEQWIQMRGAPDTPILLYLHGDRAGPRCPCPRLGSRGRNISRSSIGISAAQDALLPGTERLDAAR